MARTLGQLLYSLRNGDLLLPNFQRPFVWEPEKWQSLLASILLEYPIGTALIGTEADSQLMSINKPESIPEYNLRKVFIQKIENLNEDDLQENRAIEYLKKGKAYSCEFLLDGQQRLTSLDLIFGTAYHFAIGPELIPKNRLRWFLYLNKLGLPDLSYPNLREMPHQEAGEAIVFVKYKKTDRNSPYYYEKSEFDLANFCIAPDLQEKYGLDPGIYLPLDKLYSEDQNQKILQFNPIFLNDFFDERQETIINQTREGQKLYHKKDNISQQEYDEERKRIRRKFLTWKSKLEETLNSIIKFPFPVEEVPAKEFGRLSGIFSVINIGGIKLSTFDLLVAKTTTDKSNLRQVMNECCLESLNNFVDSINMLPKAAKESARNNINNFFNIADFLAEKNEKEINQGEEFPESISRSFAQLIALQVKLSEVLGDDWATRNNPLSNYRENSATPSLIELESPQEAARSILRLDNWGFSDKIILSIPSQAVHKVQKQAAKQLLRAYFFMKARLGIRKLSELPYRQMDLVLATVLTDSVWEQLNQDPNGTLMRKIQWWYWGSIFGGAYQKFQEKRVVADIPRLLAYLSTPSIKWNDISNLWIEGEKQLTWNNIELESDRFIEVPIAGSHNKSGNRFERICDADGYSTKDALMTSTNTAIGLSIRSFIIRNGSPDFKIRNKDTKKLERGATLHKASKDLQADHLFPRNSWKMFTGEDVNRNDHAHPVNSPLNFSWASAEANRYWSDHPSFMKLEIIPALNGDKDSLDFLHHHLLSVEAVESEYGDLLRGSEEQQKSKAREILNALLAKRFEKLRHELLKENPE